MACGIDHGVHHAQLLTVMSGSRARSVSQYAHTKDCAAGLLVLALLIDLALLGVGRVGVIRIAAHLSVALRVHHAGLRLSVLALGMAVC